MAIAKINFNDNHKNQFPKKINQPKNTNFQNKHKIAISMAMPISMSKFIYNGNKQTKKISKTNIKIAISMPMAISMSMSTSKFNYNSNKQAKKNFQNKHLKCRFGNLKIEPFQLFFNLILKLPLTLLLNKLPHNSNIHFLYLFIRQKRWCAK